MEKSQPSRKRFAARKLLAGVVLTVAANGVAAGIASASEPAPAPLKATVVSSSSIKIVVTPNAGVRWQ
ncbi:MAG: hypothetical protein AB7L13_07405 [Acidimicrobiia bacterium]